MNFLFILFKNIFSIFNDVSQKDVLFGT